MLPCVLRRKGVPHPLDGERLAPRSAVSSLSTAGSNGALCLSWIKTIVAVDASNFMVLLWARASTVVPACANNEGRIACIHVPFLGSFGAQCPVSLHALHSSRAERQTRWCKLRGIDRQSARLWRRCVVIVCHTAKAASHRSRASFFTRSYCFSFLLYLTLSPSPSLCFHFALPHFFSF